MGLFPKFIWVKNKRLKLYDTYMSWTDALKEAKHYQKKLRNNYFILKTESFHMGREVYGLYMNKIYSLY